jgi:tripeptide aminopeptidase
MIDPQAMSAEFQELVRIDSHSLQEAAVAEAVVGKLKAMGLAVVQDRAHEAIGGQTGNVIGKLPATAPGLPTVMLNAHLDTVTPGCGVVPECRDDDICSISETILGADDKAGITVILAALREIIGGGPPGGGPPHGELQVVFTIAEEIGLYGAQYLDYSLINPDYAFVFDGGREIGSLTVAAPSAQKMTWKVHGRSAHAGVCPEKGVNAVQIAAEAIAAMKLGRLDEESTANIGHIEGGAARNIVPDTCEVWGEARSHSEAKLAAQVSHMQRCFEDAAARHEGASVEKDFQSSYHSFRLSEEAEVVRVAAEAARKLGLPVKYEIGGGGSDANIFNEKGIPAVICATGARDPHTLGETVSVSGMAQAAEWLVGMIEAGR